MRDGEREGSKGKVEREGRTDKIKGGRKGNKDVPVSSEGFEEKKGRKSSSIHVSSGSAPHLSGAAPFSDAPPLSSPALGSGGHGRVGGRDGGQLRHHQDDAAAGRGGASDGGGVGGRSKEGEGGGGMRKLQYHLRPHG